ncbi:tRNA pseudouridine(13) synthase TruD [Magnetofaba australis]|uniref:tRNA pseudouridine synthase D n=1 Tax=Magnetofaba australis IT-1 TaxID=1434232 RepID=A0A1Y2K031_9PROT|nr:tRNA pseudouridine(13) synthase TruD [Magnetofaba australis]OSM00449.1 putative pseudouridylate synthase [Magnetofaba australis IT-1]
MSNENRQPTAPLENPAVAPILVPLAGPAATLGGIGGSLKRELEDFQVFEVRPLRDEPAGEHCVVTLEKRDRTTDQAAHALARASGVNRGAIGYAGLKDREGITVQAFSIHAPRGLPEDWTAGLESNLRVLDQVWRSRKIKPGQLTGNRFVIRLRDCGDAQTSDETLRERVQSIAQWVSQYGFPNAFGQQRFGRGGGNLESGLQLLAAGPRGRLPQRISRHQKGLMLSSVRSELFNRTLAQRIEAGAYTQLLEGDIAQLAGRSACFPVADLAAEQARFAAGEINATGPLFGEKMLTPHGQPGAWEAEALASLGGEALMAQLVAMRMEGQRRALRVVPKDLCIDWEGRDALFTFELPKGAYATTLLREFMGELA